MSICYSERVAVDAVAGLELSFEIDGPDGVGLIHGRIGSSGVPSLPRCSSWLDESVAFEDGGPGAEGGPSQMGALLPEPGDDLLGAPAGVELLLLEDGVDTALGRLVRAGMRLSGAIFESLVPALLESAQPLVSCLPADAVALAELGHRVDSELVVVDETDAFGHG